jgi:hypothetical protein
MPMPHFDIVRPYSTTNKVRKTLSIKKDLIPILDQICAEVKIARSVLIEYCLKAFLDSHEQVIYKINRRYNIGEKE